MCIERGAEYIERAMHHNLWFSITLNETQICMEKRAIEEGVEVCPSYAEYEALKSGVGGPRYATAEEAQAAWERGEW